MIVEWRKRQAWIGVWDLRAFYPCREWSIWNSSCDNLSSFYVPWDLVWQEIHHSVGVDQIQAFLSPSLSKADFLVESACDLRRLASHLEQLLALMMVSSTRALLKTTESLNAFNLYFVNKLKSIDLVK